MFQCDALIKAGVPSSYLASRARGLRLFLDGLCADSFFFFFETPEARPVLLRPALSDGRQPQAAIPPERERTQFTLLLSERAIPSDSGRSKPPLLDRPSLFPTPAA